MNYWLVKTDGNCYSVDDFQKDGVTPWTGVRNYMARNYMTRDMAVGDSVLFYHSSSDPTGVFGLAKVVSEAHPDASQFDKKDEHYDPKATKEKPIWHCVDIAFVKKFERPVTLPAMRLDPKLSGMILLQKGSRLSIQPVSRAHFSHIVEKMAEEK